MSFTEHISRAAQRVRRDSWRFAGIDALTGARIRTPGPMLRLGSRYGGWIVPDAILNPHSICYLVGAGEDISFDLAIAERYGCGVHIFDPTPRAIRYVSSAVAGKLGVAFHPWGLWDSDETLRFFSPANPAHVSHSIVNLQGTSDYFEAPCRSLDSIMRELQHDRVDLLKIDIEGAEHRVIASMLERDVHARILCVEFDEAVANLTAEGRDRILSTVNALLLHGYSLAAQEGRSNYTFVRL